MRITDLQQEPAGRVFPCSVCIVGAGPAGLTLATELANTHHHVLVLESGGRSREEAFSSALNEIESTGVPRVMDQRKLRNRVLGGSSHTWSGRCIPLDPIDYEVRPWVPFSGWPVSVQEIHPFLARASHYLGLSRQNFGIPADEEKSLARHLGLSEGSDLRPVLWHFSSDSGLYENYIRFGARFAKLKAPNVHVLTHATLTHINTDEDGQRVCSLEIASPQGTRYTVTPGTTVLCGGGLENARMLLASNRFQSQGIGNGHGLVGRFLMDHPRATVGIFSPGDAPVIHEVLGLQRTASGARVQGGLSLSLEVQFRERLLNAVAWTTQHIAQDDVWRAMRTLRQNKEGERLTAAKALLRGANKILPGLWSWLGHQRSLPRQFSELALDVMVEQLPDADSRLRLSTRTDALGVPLSQVDWRISDMERRTALHLAHAINGTLEGAGLPTAQMADWVRLHRWEDAVFTEAAHPAGTTRMAKNETEGVVDRQCRLFGVKNLYVAGSSVFPTSGHANPTLMIVALALRLADTLRGLPANVMPIREMRSPMHRKLPVVHSSS